MEAFKTNQLVAEDKDIQGVTISLMRHRIRWGDVESDRPVNVSSAGGKTLAIREAGLKMKGSDVKRVGLIVDADTNFSATWNMVSNLCRNLGKAPPLQCPPNGLIMEVGDQRFGVWIMPNNALAGMVENLCVDLVPATTAGLWDFALRCAQQAKQDFGAPFVDNYLSKAHIHTWLAWQPRPGEQMGIAIKNKALGHKSKTTDLFADWFINLFELQDWPKAQ